MGYDSELEKLLDKTTQGWDGVAKKKMFGGVVYMTHGNICVGIWQDHLIIRAGKSGQIVTAMQTGTDLGMQTMDQHLAQLVNEGIVTQEAAEGKVHDIDTFKQLVGRQRFGGGDDFYSMTARPEAALTGGMRA